MLLKIVLGVLYVVSNGFLMWRTLHWVGICVPQGHRKTVRVTIAVLYSLWASSLILWVVFPKGPLADLIHRIGYIWYAILAVQAFFVLVLDIILGIMKLIDKKHRIPILHSKKAYTVLGCSVVALIAAFTIYGHINAGNIVVNSYEVTIPKQSEVNELKIALVADIHLGINVGCEHLQKMVDSINRLDADIVIIAGDIYSNDYDLLDDPKQLSTIFGKIRSKYGTYAVYGNHDVRNLLIGGFTMTSDFTRDPRMEQLLLDGNVHIMKDEVLTLADGSIYLVGRLDGEITGEPGERKSLEELLQGLDPEKPLIVVNHEPVGLCEYDQKGVDVLLSGHTHAGQMFPLTLANNLVWEHVAGYKKIGDMDCFVTQGVGSYGPFVRTFTQPEVMQIDLQFEN